MIKYDENGKLERMTVEIEPDETGGDVEFNRKMLVRFNALKPHERATIIEFGFEMQARKWQEQADTISGFYNGRD